MSNSAVREHSINAQDSVQDWIEISGPVRPLRTPSRLKSRIPVYVGSNRFTGSSVAEGSPSSPEQTTEGVPLSLPPSFASQPLSSKNKPASNSLATGRSRRMPAGSLAHVNPGSTKALPAIHRLPLELLIHIFRSFIEADVGAGWMSQDRVIKLSVICRHWRSVVYNTPSLWCTISAYYHPTRLSKAIERSNGHLLDIHWVAEPFGNTSTKIHTLLGMMGSSPCLRWRSLQGRFSTQSFVDLCNHEAPHLEELDVVLSDLQDGSRLGVPVHFDTQLFRLSLNKLRNLKLQWTAQFFTLDWESMAFPSLDTLHITTANESTAPSSSELLSLLQRSDGVRELQLNLPNKSESPLPLDPEVPATPVRLHRLQRIRLMSNSSYAANVLSRLQTSSSAVMDITITLDSKEPYPTSMIQQLAPNIVSAAKQVAASSNPPERPKVALLLDHKSIVLQVGQNAFLKRKDHSIGELVERPLFHLRMFALTFHGLQRALEGLRTVLSMPNIIDPALTLSATFDRFNLPDAAAYFTSVSQVPRVTDIQLGVTEHGTPWNVDEFLKFFSQTQAGSSSSSAWPFPDLERLTICNADPTLVVEAMKKRYRGFVGGRRGPSSAHRKSSEVKPLKSLTAFWKNRVAGGYDSLRDPVVKVLGANKVLWWYESGMKGVWQ